MCSEGFVCRCVLIALESSNYVLVFSLSPGDHSSSIRPHSPCSPPFLVSFVLSRSRSPTQFFYPPGLQQCLFFEFKKRERASRSYFQCLPSVDPAGWTWLANAELPESIWSQYFGCSLCQLINGTKCVQVVPWCIHLSSTQCHHPSLQRTTLEKQQGVFIMTGLLICF